MTRSFTAIMPLDLNDIVINEMLDTLVAQGWYEWPNAVADDLCSDLLAEVQTLDEIGALRRAGIGRGDNLQINKDIRRDQIKWLDNSTRAQQDYLKQMANLQYQLNRGLFLGLFEYESHFALYKTGDFYKKHLDSFRGKANRMVTTVLYLNPHWQPESGGQLVIYNENSSQQLVKIVPKMGKMVVFMSEQIPHEVLLTQSPRISVTGWFRLNNSLAADAIDPML